MMTWYISQGLPFKNLQQIIRFHWFSQKKTKSPRESWRSLEGSNPHLHRQLWSASDTRQRVDSHWVSGETFSKVLMSSGPRGDSKTTGRLGGFFSDVFPVGLFSKHRDLYGKSHGNIRKSEAFSSRMFGQNCFWKKKKNAVQRSQLEQVSPIQCFTTSSFSTCKSRIIIQFVTKLLEPSFDSSRTIEECISNAFVVCTGLCRMRSPHVSHLGMRGSYNLPTTNPHPNALIDVLTTPTHHLWIKSSHSQATRIETSLLSHQTTCPCTCHQCLGMRFQMWSQHFPNHREQ